MEQKVITINGINAFISECRLIDNKYYLIGNINYENSGDVYLLNNRYVRFETGRLIYNITKQTYELKNQSQAVFGNIRLEGDKFIEGYFEFNPLYDFMVYDKNGSNKYTYHKCEIPLSYRELKKDGNYYHISLIKALAYKELTNVTRQLKESFPYSSEGNTGKVRDIFESNYKPLYNKNVINVSKLIGDLSFGLEFETTNGVIPNNKLHHLPLLPLRDGSIAGLEYVTIPLSGEKGLQALVDSIVELSKRTEYDSSCSLHLHIGNIPRTPEFTLALYKLYSVFSDEIYSLFPFYKKENLGVKRKNYSEPLNNINLLGCMDNKIETPEQVISNFSILFDYLADSHRTGCDFNSYGNDLNNVKSHPSDPSNTSKWQISNRYHVFNVIPLLFVNKATVEFRIHTPTYDINKILYFMVISSAIVNTAIKDQNSILKDFNGYLKRNGLKERMNLSNFVSRYIRNKNNVINKGSLIDDIVYYIEHKKNFSNIRLADGDIKYDEDDFYFKSNLDFTKKIIENIQPININNSKSPLKYRIKSSLIEQILSTGDSRNAKIDQYFKELESLTHESINTNFNNIGSTTSINPIEIEHELPSDNSENSLP